MITVYNQRWWGELPRQIRPGAAPGHHVKGNSHHQVSRGLYTESLLILAMSCFKLFISCKIHPYGRVGRGVGGFSEPPVRNPSKTNFFPSCPGESKRNSLEIILF